MKVGINEELVASRFIAHASLGDRISHLDLHELKQVTFPACARSPCEFFKLRNETFDVPLERGPGWERKSREASHLKNDERVADRDGE